VLDAVRRAWAIDVTAVEHLKLAPSGGACVRWSAQARAGSISAASPTAMPLFDLEWRLDEIAQYVDWFARPHTPRAMPWRTAAWFRSSTDRTGRLPRPPD
jgi:hypothetical protein